MNADQVSDIVSRATSSVPNTYGQETQHHAKKRRLGEHDEACVLGNTYQGATAQGQSNNVFGNVTTINVHTTSGSHERGANLHQTVKEALAFEEMADRYATIQTAHTDTCKWLFERDEYTTWRDPSRFSLHNGFFWIKGKPGAGKSTLIKTALQHGAKKTDDIIISFFFNARGSHLQQTTKGMYRSLIYQLLDKIPFAAATIPALQRPNTHHEWPVELLKEAFRALVTKLSGVSVTCYVDALDECNDSDARDMVELFESVGQSIAEKEANFRVLLSSRHYPSIDIAKCQQLILEGQEGHEMDISKYIRSKLRLKKPKQSAEIQNEIRNRASGVFLWVVLVIRILNEDIARGQVHQLKARLNTIPDGLNELFKQIMRRGSHNDAVLLLTISWIMYSSRPLSREELYFAVMTSSACNDAVLPWDKDNIDLDDMEKFLLDSSKGLAEWTRGKKPTVQFIHESVRDYLKSGGFESLDHTLRRDHDGAIHGRLKICCQTYVIRVAAVVDATACYGDRESIVGAHPFLQYALYGMLYHSDVAQSMGNYQGEYLQAFPTHRWKLMSNMCERFSARCLRTTNKVYILALNGLPRLLEALYDILPKDIWSESLLLSGEHHRSPLGAAVHSGDHRVLEFLLRHGASPNSKGRDDKSCLWLAIRKGDVNNVQTLIDAGADVHFDSSYEGNKLYAAIASGDREVMQALLAHPNYAMPWHSTFSLALASPEFHKHPQIQDVLLARLSGVEMILDAHVFQTTPIADSHGILPLACRHGLLSLVQAILRRTAPFEIFSGDPKFEHPLIEASQHGHHQIVSLLLHWRFKPFFVYSRSGKSALELASIAGHNEVVKVLSAKGTDYEAYLMALGAAARFGHFESVRTLLDHGVDQNGGAIDPTLFCPLLDACRNGYRKIVELLLEHGANPNQYTGQFTSTPMQLASLGGHTETVKALLRHKSINVNAEKACGHTSPLAFALRSNHVEIAQLLKDHGAIE